MRIRVDFYTPKLPILYRNRFISLIKEALKKSDKSFKEKLYPEEKSETTKIVKPFCFCVLMPARREPKKEKILIDSNLEVEDTVFYFNENSYISWLISSSDYEFIANLYNGLLELKSFDFCRNLKLHRKRIHLLREKPIKGESVAMKTLCPVLIETKDENPVLPDDNLDIFNTEFNAIHDRILKDIRGSGLKRELKFKPIEIKKRVVKHTLKGFREKTGKPYMTLTCFEGSFKLSGDPEDLRLLYQIGIGLRTGQGFGMVEVC